MSNIPNNSSNLQDQKPLCFKEFMERIDRDFIDCPDIIRRKAFIKNGKECYFIFIDSLTNTDLLQRDFISPILSMEYEDLSDEKKLETLPVSKIGFYSDIDSVINDILAGGIIFIYDGMNFAVSCKLMKFDKRSITEPDTEKNVRGSHEGFVEVITTNIGILRRRIKNKNLKFKLIQLGAATNQTIAIAYIDGIANPSILEDLTNRIEKINMDGLIGSGYIEQLVADNPDTPFPLFIHTERPDKVTASLLEGRFAVLLDGTPVAIIAPVTFTSFFQAPDDYNFNWIFGTFLGLIRIIAILIALFLPAIYIAITSFHYYMVPLKLLIPLAESRERVPFPPYIEALIMELTIELLREASVRLPTYIGSSIGIIGGIVIGQAAVQAGIVSVLMIIVVAVTTIASYASPIYGMGFALRILRFIIMFASSILGIIGILVCGVIIFAHLLSLESLGQPYFTPIIPLNTRDLKDAFIRLPLRYMKKRPDQPQPVDKERGRKENE